MAVTAGLAIADGQSQLTTVPVSLTSALKGATLVGHASPSQVLHVTLTMPFPNPSAVKAFADSVSNPNSPDYLKFITPQDFGAKFGQTPAKFDSMVSYLQGQGFTTKMLGDNKLTIMADCTVAQAEKAFHTTINNYHTKVAAVGVKPDFYAFSTPLQVPTELAPLVLDIAGLQNSQKPISRLKKNSVKAATSSATSSGKAKAKFGNGTTLTPTLTRTLYNVAPMYNANFKGLGRTIGISSYDGFRLTNVPLFYNTYGLTVPAGGVGSNVSVVAINGGSGSGTPQGEADLDIQMPLGQAPLATFIVYDATFITDCLSAEVNANNADIISDSWGWNIDASTADACHQLHLQMTSQGMTYMEASGDNGTSIEPFAYSNYEPDCLQVGGTIADVSGTGTRVAEVGWDGSGGGWVVKSNSWDSLPSWQKGKGVPTNINFRLNPDVSLHAAASNGAYFFFLNGSLTTADGTSFASPVFMGALAVVEQKLISIGALPPNSGKRRLGRISDFIYGQNGRSDIYFDVTSGNNGTLPNGATSNATPFWDFVTGWGPLDFNAFANSFHFVAPLTVNASTVSIYGGQGQGATGAVAQLGTVDGSYYSVGSVSNVAGQVAAAQVSYLIPNKPDPVISFVINWTANSTIPSTEFTYLLNRTTNQFDLITTNPLKSTNSPFSLTVTNLSSYLRNGQVTILHRAVVPPRLAKPFRYNLDQTNLQVNF